MFLSASTRDVGGRGICWLRILHARGGRTKKGLGERDFLNAVPHALRPGGRAGTDSQDKSMLKHTVCGDDFAQRWISCRPVRWACRELISIAVVPAGVGSPTFSRGTGRSGGGWLRWKGGEGRDGQGRGGHAAYLGHQFERLRHMAYTIAATCCACACVGVCVRARPAPTSRSPGPRAHWTCALSCQIALGATGSIVMFLTSACSQRTGQLPALSLSLCVCVCVCVSLSLPLPQVSSIASSPPSSSPTPLGSRPS